MAKLYTQVLHPENGIVLKTGKKRGCFIVKDRHNEWKLSVEHDFVRPFKNKKMWKRIKTIKR